MCLTSYPVPTSIVHAVHYGNSEIASPPARPLIHKNDFVARYFAHDTGFPFKSVMNIGYTDDLERKWCNLYNSIFCILNEKGEVLKWRFTKTTKAGEVETLFKELANRLESNDKKIEAIYIDNCCQLREKLQTFFCDKNLKIKLDLFHALNRFSKTISQRHPLKQRLLRDYRNVFRSYGDYGKKRTKATPDEKALRKNIDLFRRKWIRMRYNGKIILNKKSIKALKNIELHIDKGCLSDIPPGAGTNRNERMHRTLRKLTQRDKLGVKLAYALFLRAFHQINMAKNSTDTLQLPDEWSESFGFPSFNANLERNTETRQSYSNFDSQNDSMCISSNEVSNEIENILARANLMSNLYNAVIYRGFNENYKNSLPTVINYYERSKDSSLSQVVSNNILHERASAMNFNVVNIQGDGNCFFATLSFQIANIMQNSDSFIQNHLHQLGIQTDSSPDEIADILRKLVVNEWLSFPERYGSAFVGNEGSFEDEAKRFLQNGYYSSSLGDAMPLSAANVLKIPFIILTSVVNWPLAIITPEMSLTNVPFYLAYNQEGGGHYDALVENNTLKRQNITCNTKDDCGERPSCRCGANYKKAAPEKRYCSKETSYDENKRRYASRCACLKRGLKCTAKCKCTKCENGKKTDIKRTKKRVSTKPFFKHKSLSDSRQTSLSYMKTKNEERNTKFAMTLLEMFILESCLMYVSVKENASLILFYYNACISLFNKRNEAKLPERTEEDINKELKKREKILSDSK